jgi:hypothetical protein
LDVAYAHSWPSSASHRPHQGALNRLLDLIANELLDEAWELAGRGIRPPFRGVNDIAWVVVVYS